jgi:hypothetical protein
MSSQHRFDDGEEDEEEYLDNGSGIDDGADCLKRVNDSQKDDFAQPSSSGTRLVTASSSHLTKTSDSVSPDTLQQHVSLLDWRTSTSSMVRFFFVLFPLRYAFSL